jgi:hypothetical protein
MYLVQGTQYMNVKIAEDDDDEVHDEDIEVHDDDEVDDDDDDEVHDDDEVDDDEDDRVHDDEVYPSSLK